jgi:hypothetical protein
MLGNMPLFRGQSRLSSFIGIQKDASVIPYLSKVNIHISGVILKKRKMLAKDNAAVALGLTLLL